LHPTSLPGRHGIGDLGAEAHSFVDFLATTGQRWWQMLPLGPTGYGNSPYQSHSSFAGNPLLIDLDDLVERGWLAAEDCEKSAVAADDYADFDAVAALKGRALRLAFDRFKTKGDFAKFKEFTAENHAWLDDYVFYQALKDAHGGIPWFEWGPELVGRDPSACAQWRERLADQIRYHEFVQFAFDIQWKALRATCRDRKISLIGDLPIFVAHDSADVWANPELFYLDEHGQPQVVAGVPPDYFSETGQLWGNPLYRWEAHAADNYSWWAARLGYLLRRVDLVRIDHFRGFEAYWEIPAGSKTAAPGRWVKGPGNRFFEALRQRPGGLPLIAEDLGMITPEVLALRDEIGLPGMKVVQFGFGSDTGADTMLPYRYIPHCVVYTGTHDNDTTVGWFTSSEVATTQSLEQIHCERAFARRFLNTSGVQIHWDMIRLAFGSVADTAIIPLQDILGLDSRARMNVPGTVEGNWRWRFRTGQIDRPARERLAELTSLYGRWNGVLPKHMELRRRPEPATAASATGSSSANRPQTAP
jgi:4-alpha-glucanotransferase